MKHDHEDHVTCRELAEAMSEYIDDELTPEERKLIDTHLGLCGGCKNYLDQMQATIDAVGRLRGEPPPEETKQELLGLFRAWKQQQAER